MRSRIPPERISTVFSRALRQNDLVGDNDTSLIFYDISHLNERILDLIALFPKTTLHTVAIKANPLLKILSQVTKLGVGLEAASLPELHLAEKSGVSPDRIVFDSPVKTTTEIESALRLGCHINVDSLYELDRVADLMAENRIGSSSTIGIRINPQVGTGNIESTSVAGEYSKFGVPLKENRQELSAAFEKHDWLTGVHLHIGSQGCSVEMLLDGIEIVRKFAHEVNERLERRHFGRRITTFDIGGGLPVSYHGDKEAVPLSYYVREMRDRFKDLFTDSFRLITEFGRYLHANAGWVASKVEYVKRQADINTAMIHVGADLFLRKCYRPDDWHHEVFVVDPTGKIKEGTDSNKYIIAGPLCFAGDMIAKNIPLPVVEQGDYIMIQDTGAYTLSMWSRYNSRQIPKVIGYFENGNEFETLRNRESIDSVIEFWS